MHYYLTKQSFWQTGCTSTFVTKTIKLIQFFLRGLISPVAFVFFSLQFALGHGARRLHVSAAYRAAASVAMSRFEPTTSVNYENIRTNVNVVKKRSAFSLTRSYCLTEFFFVQYVYGKTEYVAFACFPCNYCIRFERYTLLIIRLHK